MQGLGSALGLAVVVEGVETPQAHQRLVELGFELAQGFHFNRPMSAHEVPLDGPGRRLLTRRALPVPRQKAR